MPIFKPFQRRLIFMNKKISILFLAMFFTAFAFAQQPLPDFKIIKGPKNRTILSWKNNFGDMLTVLNIQRSTDSVKGFRTIHSVNNKSLAVNAFTDSKPVPGADYYRFYYVLKNGGYHFTKAKRVATGFVSDELLNQLDSSESIVIKGVQNRTITFKSLAHLSDSVTNRTSDSLFYVNDTTIQYVRYNAVAAMASNSSKLIPVSKFLYLNADGYIVLRFPQSDLSHYSMTIFKRNGRSVLYKIPRFNNNELILSKSSFLHTGLYPYEIYKDGKLQERSKMEIK